MRAKHARAAGLMIVASMNLACSAERAVAPLVEADSPLPLASPESVGLSSERLARMTEHYRQGVAKEVGPGYVLFVARHGKLVYRSAVGLRDRERNLPMTFDTEFRIASMTKPVTSVALLMLYEEGKLQLDDPVARYLPAFAPQRVFVRVAADGTLVTEPLKRPITLRHLLTHSAGLGYGPGFDSTTPLAKLWSGADFNAAATAADKLKLMSSLPLYYQPGESWRYSYATDVLALVVEAVSGMKYAEFVESRILKPLGMTHTHFYVAAADAERLARVYRHTPEGHLTPSEYFKASAPTQAPEFPSGGGGLYSTAGDYLRFAQMLLNGGRFDGRQYLSPVTVQLMTSNQVPADAMAKFWGGNSVGLGFGLGLAPVIDAAHSPMAAMDGDFSWDGLFDTRWLASPRTGLVAVVMSQIEPTGDSTPKRTYEDFHNLLYGCVTELAPQNAAVR